MRCIEITLMPTDVFSGLRLTLTWDVLKSRIKKFICLIQNRLTLTWDVLKF